MLDSYEKVRTGCDVYCRPPVPTGEDNDPQRKHLRMILAEYGRDQLRQEVGATVTRIAHRLSDERYEWREHQRRYGGPRFEPGEYARKRPWSRLVKTTEMFHVGTHHLPAKVENRRDEATAATLFDEPKWVRVDLHGLYVRISESSEVLWAEGHLIITNGNQHLPKIRWFRRALAEHLPDETLASLWYELCLR